MVERRNAGGRSFGLAAAFGLAVGIPSFFVASRIGPAPSDDQATALTAIISAIVLGLAAAGASLFFTSRGDGIPGRRIILVMIAAVVVLFAFMLYGMVGAEQQAPPILNAV